MGPGPPFRRDQQPQGHPIPLPGLVRARQGQEPPRFRQRQPDVSLLALGAAGGNGRLQRFEAVNGRLDLVDVGWRRLTLDGRELLRRPQLDGRFEKVAAAPLSMAGTRVKIIASSGCAAPLGDKVLERGGRLTVVTPRYGRYNRPL
jgi:hypothetical protein